jgi:aspartate racemase
MARTTPPKRLGIIGGLGVLAGADIHSKMTRRVAAETRPDDVELLFKQDGFEGDDTAGANPPSLNGRKLYIYDMMRQFERQRVDSVLLPCFISHTFLHELEAELTLPIVNMMEALLAHLTPGVGGPRKLGILTSDYVKKQRLFEKYFDAKKYSLVYPSPGVQADCVMPAVYGPRGLKAGGAPEPAQALLQRACADLQRQGAELIIPGITEISMAASALRGADLPVVDANQVYVDYALGRHPRLPRPPFKIGVIGGVGPAATVDFLGKIISNTTAERDQDHLKLIVDHNPQIPDRTANLVGDGADPTLALYAACKRLEANNAALIAIPCNTAHAYVERIQPHLSIPIVNMLYLTIAQIGQHYGRAATVGLLATSGTISCGVYHDVAREAGVQLIVPDTPHQALVMRAIYGPQGVKAGHLDGLCKQDLMQALHHLVARGATVIILGCTELPLLLPRGEEVCIAGRHIALLDPTDILARRCVSLAQAACAGHEGRAAPSPGRLCPI